MKILCWNNCRGLGQTSTVQVISNMAKLFYPNLVFLVETKHDASTSSTLIKKLGFDYVDSQGIAGGL